jgi:hypothetical protein
MSDPDGRLPSAGWRLVLIALIQTARHGFVEFFVFP